MNAEPRRAANERVQGPRPDAHAGGWRGASHPPPRALPPPSFPPRPANPALGRSLPPPAPRPPPRPGRRGVARSGGRGTECGEGGRGGRVGRPAEGRGAGRGGGGEGRFTDGPTAHHPQSHTPGRRCPPLRTYLETERWATFDALRRLDRKCGVTSAGGQLGIGARQGRFDQVRRQTPARVSVPPGGGPNTAPTQPPPQTTGRTLRPVRRELALEERRRGGRANVPRCEASDRFARRIVGPSGSRNGTST